MTSARSAPTAGSRLLYAALIVGSICRVIILWQTQNLRTPIGDEQHYTQLAGHILNGDGFAWEPGRPTSIRPPLYPAIVAGIFAITGAGNFQAVRFVQLIVALATTWLVFDIGRRAYGAAVGRIAAAVFWLYPSLVFFNFTILT